MASALPSSTDFANDHLAPVRAWVHANHGSIVQLAKTMRGMTSTPISRQSVCKWLSRDESKRQEPKLGIALIMIDAVEMLQTEKQKPNP